MSFRRRIALLAGAAVAVAILLASTLAYLTLRGQLRGQVDDSLGRRAEQFAADPGPGRGPPRHGGGPHRGRFGGGPRGFHRPPQPRGGFDFFEQLVDADGTAFARSPEDRIPITDATRAVAAGRSGAAYFDASIGAQRVRVLARPLPGGGAVQVARSLREVDTILARTRWILLVVALGGIALAALLGRLVAGRAIDPLRRLTSTAEHVAATQDLGSRIDAGGSDEIGRLATSFNEMLDALQSSMQALDASVQAQRQLVADASHELRTPVTSLRTNIEVLQANPDLEPERRARLLSRAIAQVEELTALMNDLIDLARGDRPEQGREPLRLDELVEEAVERAARHAPGQRFALDLEETTVLGSAGRLAKAVNNLLDNAVRWNQPGRPIDVSLHDGELVVRDRGTGFATDELEHVFDRFFRGAQARDRAGSGLGLAIVRQVAEAHGGSIDAYNAADGGAVLRLRLPASEPGPAPIKTARATS